MISYTPEQADILDHAIEHNGILLVEAGAGTGKSFMAKRITLALQPSKGLYTAFNKAIVEDGKYKFEGTNMECKTLHALAYKHVNPSQKISDLTYTCVEEKISYSMKYEVINAINMFYVSSSSDMYQFFQGYFPEDFPKRAVIIGLCEKYVEKMVEGELPPTFNFLLKFFHLMLLEGKVKAKYDLVILDEINDTTAVALEIFKLLDAEKKIGLGESNQAIYQFLNLVNGFEELSDSPKLSLTQSWRCSVEIASKIENFMQKEVSENFNFIGTDEPVVNGKFLFCTGTNALIIDRIQHRLAEGKGFYLLRKLSEIFAAPMAILTASRGQKPYQKKYKFLLDEYNYWQRNKEKGQSYFQYLLEHVDDKEITNAVNLLMSFKRKGINLFDLYNQAKNAPVDHKYTIATVFTSKGLEYETVEIADDLNAAVEQVRESGGIQTIEDLVVYRCYYVACSRAGKTLISAKALKC